MLAIGSVLQPCAYTKATSDCNQTRLTQLDQTRLYRLWASYCCQPTRHPLLNSAYFTDADDKRPCFAWSDQCMNVVNAGPESKGRWQAPALSSLVSRLAQPPGKPPQPSSPSWHQPPPQADQEVFLDASSDEEDTEAASAGPGPEASGQELNLSIYSAAAGPFKALLACVGQAPGASYLFCCVAIVRIHIHIQHLLVCFAATQTLLLNIPQLLCCRCLLVFILLQMVSQAFLHQVCYF